MPAGGGGGGGGGCCSTTFRLKRMIHVKRRPTGLIDGLHFSLLAMIK